jgi:hypothetical protein
MSSGSTKGSPLSGLRDLLISPPSDFFRWSFLKDKDCFPPVPITPKNLKDRVRTVSTRSDHSLLQIFWQETKYLLDVCRGTSGARVKLA